MKAQLALALALAFTVVHAPSSSALRAADQASVAPEAEAPEAVAKRVAELVPKLDADDFRVRREAAMLLKNLPGSAHGPVRAALARASVSTEARTHLDAAAKLLGARHRNENRFNDLRWNRESAVAAYDAVGRRDPKWDKDAREALRLFPRAGFNPRVVPGADDARRAAFERAVAAGCDDPLVLYCYARLLEEPEHNDPDAYTRLYKRAADGMRKSRYPALRKAYALARYGLRLSGTDATLAHREVLNLLPDAAREPGVRPAHVLSLARMAFDGMSHAVSPKVAYEAVEAALEKALPGGVEPLLFRGEYLAKLAFDDPPPPPAGLPPDGAANGGDPMESALARAGDALQQAWERDPSDARAPILMMNARLNLDAPPEQVDLWYARATAADPDSYTAAMRKLELLGAQPVGGHEAMLRFGRECREGGNYYGRLPFILVEAHSRVAAEQGDRDAYLARDDVWADIRGVYEQYLRLFPDHDWHRNGYAKWACECGRWPEADRLFRQIGERPDLRVFGGQGEFDYYRQIAAERAGQEREE